MRGGSKSKMTEAERRQHARAAARRFNRHHYENVVIPNLARGLTARGQTPLKAQVLSAATQKLVAEYKARQAKTQAPDATMSQTELEWRKLRAAMGDITVPEIKLYSAGRGEEA